jgi:EAL domain-containing protein (putative c-di-GMP-specific phosphodiesterase class I)
MIQDSFKIDSRKVNFEITESAYENSSEIMAANMNALQASGFSISLDDYGTGYSNMLRILNIPLSIIKLDKSLTDQIKTKKGRTVVKNTISMMHDINMNLVVEGIETKDTLDELEKMGADYIQGFYFSKPLPEKEFIEFIKKHNTGII